MCPPICDPVSLTPILKEAAFSLISWFIVNAPNRNLAHFRSLLTSRIWNYTHVHTFWYQCWLVLEVEQGCARWTSLSHVRSHCTHWRLGLHMFVFTNTHSSEKYTYFDMYWFHRKLHVSALRWHITHVDINSMCILNYASYSLPWPSFSETYCFRSSPYWKQTR